MVLKLVWVDKLALSNVVRDLVLKEIQGAHNGKWV